MRETVNNLRRAVTTLVVTLMFCVTLLAAMNTSVEGMDIVPNTTPAPVPHGCWTGEAPKGVAIPGHVYAILPGGESGVFGPEWTGKALAQVIENDPTFGLTVLAFCR